MTAEVKASKNDSEKADLSLIPRVALEAAARAFMVGEKKYGRYNFYKGHNASQLVAALLRHATAWMEGEETDPQDGQHHLGSVIACAAMLLQQQKLGTLKDNRHNKLGSFVDVSTLDEASQIRIKEIQSEITRLDLKADELLKSFPEYDIKISTPTSEQLKYYKDIKGE